MLDWIEILLEEINEQIDLMSAKLENAVGITQKNNIIDDLIDVNTTKMDKLKAGIEEYTRYLGELLAEVPAEYREAVQNGAIEIEEFYGETDEATVEAINNYREWAEKVADLTQEFEELKTEISKLAKQKLDNITDYFDDKSSVYENMADYISAYVDGVETIGYVASPKSYEFMTKATKEQIKLLEQEKKLLLENFEEQVRLGNIPVGSEDWYEIIGALQEIDQETLECQIQLEEYINKMNDIKWDNFDQLISRLDGVSNETQNLIDLMEASDDLFDDNGNWTKEGITSLGLYAQQMETAAYEADQYAKAIDSLEKDYAKGLYTEQEYIDKLNELKNGQYDATQSYYDAQDAIVELNKARVDAIKDGIQKEIDAYEKLIQKKKEELNAEKDLHGFQKSVMDQQKNIAEIKRKIAALSMDNSASAVAERKKLQAELAEAEAELEETYYDRSVQNQQDALDQGLDNYKETKDAELEELDEYLENVKQVVAESLGIVKDNSDVVYETLGEKAKEYNLTLSDAVVSPWSKGELAIGSYKDTFGVVASYTREELKDIRKEWQETINMINEDATMMNGVVIQDAKDYTKAGKKEPEKPKKDKDNDKSNTPSSGGSKPSLSNGSTVKIKTTATHFSSNSGSLPMASFIPGGTYTVYEVEGDQVLIGKDGVYTGWVKKTDIQGYATGTTSLKKSGIVNVDELGEELILGAQNGRLTYLEKGSGVIPADVTSNLMSWGELDPQEMLDRNRPSVTPSKSVVNNNMEIRVDASVGTLLHVERLDGNNPEEVIKLVDKAWEKKMQGLNSAIKRFAR